MWVGRWDFDLGPTALYLSLPHSLRAGAQPKVGVRGIWGGGRAGTDSEALVQAFQPPPNRVFGS